MSVLGNITKAFHFAIDIAGVEQVSIQKVSGLEIEMETVAHGEADHDVYTPGRVKFGKITLERVQQDLDYVQGDFWAWLQQARKLGAASKRTFTVRQLGADGVTTVRMWQVVSVFPTKVTVGDLSRTASENVIEKIELSPPDDLIKLL